MMNYKEKQYAINEELRDQYQGRNAGEINRARASQTTSEEIQGHVEAFLAKDGIIKRYYNLNVEIIS